MAKNILTNNRLDFASQAALEYEIYSYNEVVHYHAHHFLGAFWNSETQETIFRFFDPDVQAVSLVGSFNNWNPKSHPMTKIHPSGYWQIKLRNIEIGSAYQFALFNQLNSSIEYLNDPYALGVILADRVASSVENRRNYIWQDADWIKSRESQDLSQKPISVYSCDIVESSDFKTYQELAKHLTEIAHSQGFTHIELKNFIEKVNDLTSQLIDYQLFVPYLGLGRREDFKCLVDYLHQQGIGVILSLPFFEIIDSSIDFQQTQFRNRLFSSSIYWLEEFHADGFSFDGFSEVNYNEPNAEVLFEFIRTLNEKINNRSNGVFTFCKTNSVLPEISMPTFKDGFGFNMKANFLFNNSLFKIFHTLHTEPEDILASSFNAFAQNHILFSDPDLIASGPDDLKLMLMMMMCFPGKKLITEKYIKKASLVLGQNNFKKLLAKLNSIYKTCSALHEGDFRNTTFEWQDYSTNCFSFLRWSHSYQETALIIINSSAKDLTAQPIGVPKQGLYLELFNSKSDLSAQHLHSSQGLYTIKQETNNRPCSLVMDVPAKSGLILTNCSP
jgi:1,4-alpha-glucan branching enzyme